MNYAAIKEMDIANGTGVRVSLFVSGCTRKCKGCFNAEAWDFNAGKPFTRDTLDHILSILKHDYISGLSILGGEPLEPRNLEMVELIVFIVRSKFPEKNIWLYSGYTYDEIMQVSPAILDYIDVLVDGPFIEEEKDISLLFRGSRNQRVIDLKKTRSSGHVELWRTHGG